MIDRIIQFALRQRILVIIAALALLGWGAYSFTQLPIEAYPDVMNTQVQIIAQWPGHAAEEVEQQITVPLEISPSERPAVIAVIQSSATTQKTAGRCADSYRQDRISTK